MILLEILEVLVLLESNFYLFFSQKWIMPIIQDNENFDFSNCTIEEKKDLIVRLLNRQKRIAYFLIQNYTSNIGLRIHLMFTIMICESSFASYFVTIYLIAL